jgi:nuclear GTP-binding protein
VRVENVENPEQYIPAVLEKVERRRMERTYQVKGWESHLQLLELLARKSGRLLKGGEPDGRLKYKSFQPDDMLTDYIVDGAAKIVLNDFMRGNIPWYTPAPAIEDDGQSMEGREGRLGEMPRKRKRDNEENLQATPSELATGVPAGDSSDLEGNDDDEPPFEGFDNDSAGAATKQSSKHSTLDAGDDSEDVISIGELSDEDASSDDS